jgi:hypothetical protein
MMEYCGLGSVQDAMSLLADSEGEEEGSIGLCEEDIAYILKSVVSGLVYLHYKKIIHRYRPCQSSQSRASASTEQTATTHTHTHTHTNNIITVISRRVTSC